MPHAMDSTVIRLVSNCIDWAKYRRRKAAAKVHLRLDLGSFGQRQLFFPVRKYDWSNSDQVFVEWLESFLSTGRHDPLKKLIHLHFKELTTNEGYPLMSFNEILVQTLAVSLYLDEGGEVDEERNQNRYFLGRAAISPWGSSRQAAVGAYYDKKMRTTTQRQPKLFQRAFRIMLENTGILSIIVRIKKEQKEVLER